jgi:hypothetical protein
VRFCKQPSRFQAPRLPRACNSPYFYLFASLILAKANHCPVVQGQSFSRLHSLFHLGTLLFEPFPVSGPLLVIFWLIVIFLGPFSGKRLFTSCRWFPSCLVVLILSLVFVGSWSVVGSFWFFGFACSQSLRCQWSLSVVGVGGSMVNCWKATQGQ